MSEAEKVSNVGDNEKSPSKSKLGLVVVLVLVVIGAVAVYFLAGNVADGEDSVDGAGSPDVAMESFLDNLQEKNLEYVDEETKLEDKIDFAGWDDIKGVNVPGINNESDDVALARADFEFTRDLEDGEVFEYPLTLVFVLEKDAGSWVISDVEYDLERFKEAE